MGCTRPHGAGPLKTPLVTQGEATDTEGKQLYGEEDIAALMGFSNVQLGSQLQDIRAYFNTSMADLCPHEAVVV
jgi:hypothetical protein